MRYLLLHIAVLISISVYSQKKHTFNHMISYEYKSYNGEVDSRAYAYINTINNDYFLSLKEIGNNQFHVFFKHKKGFQQSGNVDIKSFFDTTNIYFDHYYSLPKGFQNNILPYSTKLRKQKDTVINRQEMEYHILSSTRRRRIIKDHPEFSYKSHFLTNKNSEKYFDYNFYSGYPSWKSELALPIGNFER